MHINTLLLDRDGTIIEDPGYLKDPANVALLPNVGEALKKCTDAGMQLFVVTNQSGVQRGMCTIEDVHACNERMTQLLKECGVVITDIEFCTDIENTSPNRKPNPGMWYSLVQKYPLLDAKNTMMIGDKDADTEFGKNIGVKTVRIDSGQYPFKIEADYTIKNLKQLVDILQV